LSKEREKSMELIELKERLRASRETMPQVHAVRLHRALSWLRAAEEQAANPDMQFISLWIAFNSCYGVDEDKHIELAEREIFQRFAYKLVKHDPAKKIYNLFWQKFAGPVKALINNQFVFRPFWEAQRDIARGGDGKSIDWQNRFDKSCTAARNHLAKQQVPELLGVVLDRLYVLRNQVMHGGATYQSQVNREQVLDGCHMLSSLMPVIVEIMLEAKEENWGVIYYPVVGQG
jgi:hypothetical protein